MNLTETYRLVIEHSSNEDSLMDRGPKFTRYIDAKLRYVHKFGDWTSIVFDSEYNRDVIILKESLQLAFRLKVEFISLRKGHYVLSRIYVKGQNPWHTLDLSGCCHRYKKACLGNVSQANKVVKTEKELKEYLSTIKSAYESCGKEDIKNIHNPILARKIRQYVRDATPKRLVWVTK